MQRAERLSGAEVVGLSALSLFASPILIAYLLDRVGFPFHPFVVLPLTVASAAASFLWLRHGAVWRAGDLIAFISIFGVIFGWLLWLARPDFLPTGKGTDLTHHLMLVAFLEQHWRLVHDPGAEAILGGIVHYTPGSQLLAAFCGAWTGTDGLHAMHALVAASVALKAGFLFLIARRLFAAELAGIPLATTAVLLFFVPSAYAIGSFTVFSFFAQVVAELFAVSMWWALVAWDEQPSTRSAAVFAIAGTAAFLTWPVWVGAPMLLFLVLLLTHTELSLGQRVKHLLIGTGAIVAIGGLFFAEHARSIMILQTGGSVLRPLPREYGWLFLTLSSIGLIVAAIRRRGRVTALLVAAIAIEAVALLAVARMHGNDTPYMALKMFYLAIGPQAVAGALTLGVIWQLFARVTRPVVPRDFFRGAGAEWLAWGLAAILAVRVVRPLLAMRQPQPVISDSLYRAGRWAAEHVPRACVDYLVGDDDAAYWLHLAVLGNPEVSARTEAVDTFEPREAVVRWLTPGGLPFAIAELPALPRDVRSDLSIVADFGTAAVVKRQGPSSCLDQQ